MDQGRLRNLAFDILARRDHSSYEMSAKLKKKGATQEEITDTIEWLSSKKLMNDRIFAQRKAESIFRTKAVGPQYIALKLQQARISQDIIEGTISALASQEQWREKSRQALESWKRAHPKYKEDKVRQQRFLSSRGFDFYND